jgi:hypothetical protein
MVSLQAFDIEARIAYFLPQDTRMRDIYGKNGLPEYEIEVSAPFQSCCDCSCDWDTWAIMMEAATQAACIIVLG